MNSIEENYSALYRIAMSIGDSSDLIPMLDKSLRVFNRELALDGSGVLFFKIESDKGLSLEAVHYVPDDEKQSVALREALKHVDAICNSLTQNEIEDRLPFREKLSGDSSLFAYSLPYIGVLILLKRGNPFPELIDDEITMLAGKISFACSTCLRKSEVDMISRSTTLLNRELAGAERNLVRMVEEMRRAQDELNTGKNHLALILQSLGEGVVVVDSDSNVLLSNIRALEYFDVMPADGSAFKLDELLVNCCEGEKPVIDMSNGGDASDKVVEFEVCGRHDARRFLRVTAQGLETLLAGAPETIYLVQDITREREIDRMKNEFISNLSHELRTPMNAILGISKMLTEKNSDNLSERQKQGLSIVYESGHRLLTLINDILDLSKIEAGKMDILIRPVNAREMIGRIAKMAEPLASADVSFKVEISPDVPDVIYVDEDRIQQVVINLMGNSFKFTSEGTVCLSIERSGDRIVMAVADTGIGISPENLPFIFDRFRQGDGSMSRKYQGTGIGLSLSREIVALMGGTISAESVYGKGTIIRFDVPIGAPDMAVESEALSARQSTTAGSDTQNASMRMNTLLVAEDEETGRETLRFLLSDRYHLVFARNGDEACAEFDGNRIDLVLMDIMMPGTDGYTAYDRIRGTEKGKGVPIVAVTARAMTGEREKILAYGFDAYVSKPIDSGTLIETIEKLLESHINGGSHE